MTDLPWLELNLTVALTFTVKDEPKKVSSVMTQIGTFRPFSTNHFQESSIEINGLIINFFFGIEIAF